MPCPAAAGCRQKMPSRAMFGYLRVRCHCRPLPTRCTPCSLADKKCTLPASHMQPSAAGFVVRRGDGAYRLRPRASSARQQRGRAASSEQPAASGQWRHSATALAIHCHCLRGSVQQRAHALRKLPTAYASLNDNANAKSAQCTRTCTCSANSSNGFKLRWSAAISMALALALALALACSLEAPGH